MSDTLTIQSGVYGTRAVLHSTWSDELIPVFAAHEVAELELNVAKGWRGNNLGFLAKIPDLRCIEILDLGIADIGPIHYLHRLRKLEIMTYCSTAIDFAAFPHLEDCGLEWRPRAASLFQCTTLRRLHLNRYKGKDTEPFSRLGNLESLAILNAPIDNLHGLAPLTRLRSLRLAGLRRLTSLSGIETLSHLQELEVNTCRSVRTIKEISGLTQLRVLLLNNNGEIDSLWPLAHLGQLETVTFYESTNILDGNLTPLKQLRSLSSVSFQNRRHYSHRREEFGRAYTG